MLKKKLPAIGLIICCTFVKIIYSAEMSHHWGRLANPGFEGRRIKSTLFFPGQARDGSNRYSCNILPIENLSLYTAKPLDNKHLQWSENKKNRDFALDQMVEAGINVVNMSSWGEDFLTCGESWGPWAPMQTAPESHEELFTSVVNKPLLIIPFIESRGNWNLRNEFPLWTDGRVAPGTVSQVINLIERFLQNALHPQWAAQWARMYDSSGNIRYAVALRSRAKIKSHL